MRFGIIVTVGDPFIRRGLAQRTVVNTFRLLCQREPDASGYGSQTRKRRHSLCK